VYALPNNMPTEAKGLYGDKLDYRNTILGNIKDVIVTTSADLAITSWNKAAEEAFGFPEQAVTGKLFNELVNFRFNCTTLDKIFFELEEKGCWKGEITCTKKNGGNCYFLFTISLMENETSADTGLLFTAKDITEEKTRQDKIFQSEKFYRGLVADALDGILLLDISGLVSYASPSVVTILGFEPAEAIGNSAFIYIHPDDRALALESFEKERQDSSVVKYIVIRLLKKTGDWLWCMCRAHNLLTNPYVNGVVIYFHDDTLRQNATEALRQSEQRFRNLVSELQIGIVLQNPEGTIMMSNAAMFKMLSSSEHELVGRKIWEVFPDIIREDLSYFEPEERPSYTSITMKKAVSDVVMGVRHPRTDKYIWLLVNAHPILDNESNVQSVICSFTDITERKKLEQKLLSEQLSHQRLLTQATIDSQEKERREIGKELHDNIGQRLTTIKLYLDLAQSTADSSTSEMIILSQRNISDVINEIRSLCRALIPSSLGDLGLVECINDLIQGVSRAQKLQFLFQHSQFNESILLENQKLMVFRIVQEQVNNIVKHAEASRIIIRLVNDDDLLVLEINDDGNGFDTESIKRGLGLTNMKNRAELLGGNFSLISTPGKGTTVLVTIAP
jgi:PAS domain S-box-containing protein